MDKFEGLNAYEILVTITKILVAEPVTKASNVKDSSDLFIPVEQYVTNMFSWAGGPVFAATKKNIRANTAATTLRHKLCCNVVWLSMFLFQQGSKESICRDLTSYMKKSSSCTGCLPGTCCNMAPQYPLS